MAEPTHTSCPGFPDPVQMMGKKFMPADGFFIGGMADQEGHPARILLMVHRDGDGLHTTLDAASARSLAKTLNAVAAQMENRASMMADAAFARARAKKGGAA